MVITGDCLEVMPTLDAESIDSIVTDPPYGLSFMGKTWDHGVPGVDFWREALRVAKPGAHLLAFGGTRTYHRLTCAIEDAGWEIRDCIMWVYGSGFPKSLDVSKAIDKAAGDATPAAIQWNGWGTALKPAWEPIIVARKPLRGTVAANVLEHGTGALNIDGARVEGEAWAKNTSVTAPIGKPVETCADHEWGLREIEKHSHAAGRFPANLIHDGSEDVCGLLGDAARFFYCAKASKADRDGGCDDMGVRKGRQCYDSKYHEGGGFLPPQKGNHHPTVKPNTLMRYLCRLVTPPGGLILDPFCGSGSTGKAAVMEGFRFLGIELDAEYAKIAEARINAVATTEELF